MREYGNNGMTRQTYTDQSLMSGSSSQTDLMKTDMVRRVFYQHKDLQLKYDQLLNEHQKLNLKYDKLAKVSKELKDKYEDLKKARKDRSEMAFSEENVQSAGIEVSADSFEMGEIPFINTFFKATEHPKHQQSYQAAVNTSAGQESRG